MTLPSVIRIFFAIDLPQDAKERLSKFIGALKKEAKSNAIRWTKAENLHITLQFLAEVRTEHLSVLIEKVREEVQHSAKSLTLSLGAWHLFPNPYRPRVIVLEVTPHAELAVLSGLIGKGIQAMDYAIESRPFRAHLTLGRIKHTPVNLDFLSACTLPEIPGITITEVVMFRSEPQPEGSQYTVMEKINLPNPLTPPKIIGGEDTARQ